MGTNNRKNSGSRNTSSRSNREDNVENRFTTPRMVNSKRNENLYRLSARKTGKVNKKPVNHGVDTGAVLVGILSIIAVALLVFLIWGLFHKNAQAVLIDGEQIAAIKDMNTTTSEFNELLTAKLKDKTGNNVQINETVALTPIHTSRKNITNNTDYVLTTVCNSLTYKREASAITVNGNELAVLANQNEAQGLLDQILALYQPEEGSNAAVSFVDDVQITSKFVEDDEIMSTVKAYDILSANTTQEQTYTVQSGDSFSGIASKAEMSETRLLELNPSITADTKHMLKIGQELVIETPVPVLSIKTTETVTRTEPIEIPVETVNNNNEYKTYRKVISPGSEGSKEVTEQVVMVNGYETERTVVSEKVLTEAVPQKVEIGTLQTPPKRAIGNYIYPVSGARFSSGFGYRGGENHSGIDLCASAGTSVYASDGGKIVNAGDRGDGYGNLVIIDHGNGFQTYYAHNSQVLVTVGQDVAQGEAIAKVGSTGNSSGNHVHFEVRKNGTPVNPIDYLS